MHFHALSFMFIFSLLARSQTSLHFGSDRHFEHKTILRIFPPGKKWKPILCWSLPIPRPNLRHVVITGTSNFRVNKLKRKNSLPIYNGLKAFWIAEMTGLSINLNSCFWQLANLCSSIFLDFSIFFSFPLHSTFSITSTHKCPFLGRSPPWLFSSVHLLPIPELWVYLGISILDYVDPGGNQKFLQATPAL